ncbi:FCD domain-containing protein [Pasteurellaceae bacterium HPA106]|uniref:FCD domain-containing protein n=1 Tax=Spirabiliibacterium pneumoniae TaxID=221400 RepID=UPI001AAC806D|nr:FCD domain-containing protein [Spirabiliibacterium pneumoniae]MBE2896877.1 FCD domain-containing protein [Spirabiliibacterium pneumoniae]
MTEKQAFRSYKKIGEMLKQKLASGLYAVGDRLPPERDFAEELNVSRTVIREAMIMLELEGLIEIRKGSGSYVVALPSQTKQVSHYTGDIGPFELLQARQLLESSIAEFAAIQANRSDIAKLKAILDRERATLEHGDEDYIADKDFHIAIAEITQNEALIRLQKNLWRYRTDSHMWQALHSHIPNQNYRVLWLTDHQNIINAIQRKDPVAAKKAMWQHIENVKQKLFELSDIDDPNFDGYLFNINPVTVGI